MIKIAVPVEDNRLCPHFGHCQNFAVIEVDTENKKIINRVDLTPPPHEPGILPKWLADQGVNMIIAGGMGSRAQEFFRQFNIDVVVGAIQETPETLALDYVSSKLQIGDNACDH